MKTALSKSSLFFGTLLFCLLLVPISGKGQVEYTDVTPNAYITSNLGVDINMDGENDFILKRVRYQYGTFEWRVLCTIHPEDNIEVAVTEGYVSALTYYDSIDADLTWINDDTLTLFMTDDDNDEGEWIDVDKGFVGLRIKEGDEYRYAWIRLIADTDYYLSMWLADHAINSDPDKLIQAGEGMPLSATSVVASDVNDYFDGRDIRVSFTKANDESIISEYRIMLAKAGDSTAYDLEVMNQLTEERYLRLLINPADDANIRKFNLTEDAVDKDGNSIVEFVDYKVHILNISNSGNPDSNMLSKPSSDFILQAFSEAVRNIIAYDNANSNSAADINITFKMAEAEKFINEYRVFIAEAAQAEDFNINLALSLSQDYYTSYVPDSNDVDILLNPEQLDVNANAITNGNEYVALVLSVADSVYSVTSAMSSVRKLLLNDPNIFVAGQKEGENISYFEFDPVPDINYAPENSYGFDLNGDSTIDFTFHGNYLTGHPCLFKRFYVTPERNNKVLLCEHEEHTMWAEVLRNNEQIGDNFRWLNDETVIYDLTDDAVVSNSYEWGHWYNVWGTKYIGLCLMDSETPVYGWIVIERGGVDWNFRFIEYAYMDPTSGNSELNIQNEISISPNPARDFILLRRMSLNPLNLSSEAQVKIYNSQGSITDEFVFEGAKYKLGLAAYPSGMYFCYISIDGKYAETIKFVVY